MSFFITITEIKKAVRKPINATDEFVCTLR